MSTSRDRVRVVVASEHALIADTVRAALARGGHDVTVVGWPTDEEQGPRELRPSPHAETPDVGILLCDLERWQTVHAASSVVASVQVPWVVLTGSPRGPSWGAILDAGVELVLAESTRLEELDDLLVAVAERRTATPLDERTELVSAWRELHADNSC